MAITLFVVFFFLLVLGAPIVFAIGVGTTAALIAGGIPLEILPEKIFSGLAHFPYLAVPLFVLAGMLMETGGISKRIVDLSNALVGHIRGGMGIVVMVATIFFSDISGSSAADTAAIGSVMIPPMKKRGYAPNFAAALVTAAGGMGVLIPPCLTMVVFGSLTNTSIGALFLAGFIPGISMGIILMILTYIIARKKNLPKEKRATFIELLVAFKRSFLSLFMGVIILGGIILGIFTATEAAAVAVIYGFFLSVVFYKEIKLSQLPEILWKSAVISGVVMFVVGISYGFGWVMGKEQVPLKLANFMISIPGGKWMFLFAVNILLLAMGMFFDASLSVVILVPILFPVAVKLGIHPVHFGTFVVMNLGIGFTTPPFGLSLFIASGIAKIPLTSIIKPILPYILTMIGFLFVVTYVPWFSMILPKIFMGY
ncbi:MAG: TRAP transporter large permease [Deltaproteobacteria bacterium]|nr:TRAP transporter large permease [Deltaproteobacteria bacterium]MBW1934351.1 TRAP transporter large permease [Deltaproteobacteria bacterium]MBW1978471.1 TRAP transporter large permease [Deltaproteobacteria bacterium]MBW2043465.1 TRAP transporter large permease [Deltaproteobacteria bacterium]MBW2299415.1 TRAP transporter large permease [Deltaproteobacteria bacterium]